MKNYFIKNKKGEYLTQIGRKFEFKEGLMLALAFDTRDNATHFALNNNSKALKNCNVDIECIEFDDKV